MDIYNGLWPVMYRASSDDERQKIAELHACAQVSVSVSTEGYYPESVSLLADVRAKIGMCVFDAENSVRESFITNAVNPTKARTTAIALRGHISPLKNPKDPPRYLCCAYAKPLAKLTFLTKIETLEDTGASLY